MNHSMKNNFIKNNNETAGDEDKHNTLSRSSLRETTRKLTSDMMLIKSTEELEIDFSNQLKKRKTIISLKDKVYKCKSLNPAFKNIDLILKKQDCMDKKTQDKKLFEIEFFQRFARNKNIVNLQSQWSEAHTNPQIFKSIIILQEWCEKGDLVSIIHDVHWVNNKRLSNVLVYKQAVDIAEALANIHSNGLIHGGVRTKSILIDSNNNAKLSEFRKIELDMAISNSQLFSTLNPQEVLEEILIQWSPEIVFKKTYSFESDIWAQGVLLYQLCTGVHPFQTDSIEQQKDDLKKINIKLNVLDNQPLIKNICRDIFIQEPEKRIKTKDIIFTFKNWFATKIQCLFKSFKIRLRFKRLLSSAVKIQSTFRMQLQRKKQLSQQEKRRNNSAKLIQDRFRAFMNNKAKNKILMSAMKIQSTYLSATQSKNYQRTRFSAVQCQAFIRRFLSMKWFQEIRLRKNMLLKDLNDITAKINLFNKDANKFNNLFMEQRITKTQEPLRSFENQVILHDEIRQLFPQIKNKMDVINNLECEREILVEENTRLSEEIKHQDRERLEMKEKLGDKQDEQQPEMAKLKTRLHKINLLMKKSVKLEIEMMKEYMQDRWERMMEPKNLVENILADDESIFKTTNPVFDLKFSKGRCFLGQIHVHPGDTGPKQIQVFVANEIDNWYMLEEQQLENSNTQIIKVTGFQVCNFLRIKCLKNLRQGHLVEIRHIEVYGLLENEIEDD